MRCKSGCEDRGGRDWLQSVTTRPFLTACDRACGLTPHAFVSPRFPAGRRQHRSSCRFFGGHAAAIFHRSTN
ncbi:hypothetical protein RHECNPAF_122100159 [Rhizobium etli CNPAF512]|nr:hypothetical protein RHECNPAF_122100159 [Rhizobium etli CNPAF512]